MFWIIAVTIFVINLFLIITMILFERKNAQSVLSWTLVLTIFPIGGFIFYIVLGNSLSIKTRRMLFKKRFINSQFNEYVHRQRLDIDKGELSLREIESKHKQLIRQNILDCKGILTQNNKIEIISGGKKFLEMLLNDIQSAKKSINMLFYIFATDKVGDVVLDALINKASEGVEVNLLVDAVGSLKSSRRKFKKLVSAGGRYAEFFPPLWGFRMFNVRLNYRNHRKIVVIDNKIGYTGGLNIRNDHMGENKKVAPWTDMMVRVQGDAVFDLQKLFLGDWRFAYGKEDFEKSDLLRFFNLDEGERCDGESGAQVIYSGPDNESQQIKKALIKMILSAKQSVVLESPYFVPDDSFIEALKIASASGVDIKIITPKLPDKKVVYYTSLSYLKDVVKSNIRVYQRDGFLHSKCLIVDDEICAIGTCNADIRSFKLNFEDMIIVYDDKVTKQLKSIVNCDIENSNEIDFEWFKRMPAGKKMAKSFYRLFSAIL